LAGCTVNGSVIETAEERHTFDGVGETPSIVVETFNGRISVQVAGDGVVEARVTRRGSGTSAVAAERDLARVDVAFERLGDAIRITARRLDGATPLGNSGADIEVTVPAA